jgi:hypothetical protein
MATRREKAQVERKSDIKYVFRTEPSQDGYDVVRSIHGSSQSWVIMHYVHLADAAYLVQTLQMLEIWHELRQRRDELAGKVTPRRL